MKQNKVTIQVHAYTLTLKDLRTNDVANDTVILTKEQLKAAHETGLGLEGILTAVYNRKGYHVTRISAPVKRTFSVDIAADADKILVPGFGYDAETKKGASV